MDNVQLTFHPSSSENGSAAATYSPIFDLSGFSRLVVSTALDSISAGDELTVQIEDSMDGIHWSTALTFGPIMAPEVVRLSTADFGRFVRAQYIWSAASAIATFSVLGMGREY